MGIQRYRFDGVDLVEHNLGRWIRQADHAAEVARLKAVLAGVIDQLDGIGIPEWGGAEGLDLDEARATLDPE